MNLFPMHNIEWSAQKTTDLFMASRYLIFRFQQKFNLCLWVSYFLVLTTSEAQPYISSDTPPSCYEIEARIRNGNAEFESAIYTPSTPSPYDPGSIKWQLNPQGLPVWNSNGNTYGDIHSFQFTYTPATGASVWNVDFNRDGDYADYKESVTNLAPTLIGKGFQYISIFGQGNDVGKTVSLHHFTINAVDFGWFSSSTNTPFSYLFEDSTGLFNDIIISGQFAFSGKGTSERPRIWVQLGESNIAPSCILTSPADGVVYNQGDTVFMKASATDPSGQIMKVEFYDRNIKIGEDLTYPYSFNYLNVPSGSRTLRAKAIDNHQAMAFSDTINIHVTGPPMVSIFAPLDGAILFDPDTILILAQIENDSGNVVEFFLDNIAIGTDDTSPYNNITLQNHPMGTYTVTAKSTSNLGQISNSQMVRITIRCIREDINNDGYVNTFDFLLFLGAFGTDCVSGCPSDFNDDTVVNTMDFIRLLAKLGYSCF